MFVQRLYFLLVIVVNGSVSGVWFTAKCLMRYHARPPDLN